MPVLPDLRQMLATGDRRSVGRVAEVVDLLRDQPQHVAKLIPLLWEENSAVRMRAADALEKISCEQPRLLAPFRSELLGLMAETTQQELRWHLAQMAPRMSLASPQRRRAMAILESYLSDRSSIVKTFAMQGLWELSLLEPSLRAGVIETIRQLTRSGTPAMRARGRNLLKLSG
jgi:hypothetical protein